MSRRRRWAVALGAGLGCALLGAAAAHAQLSAGRGPISYSADNLEYNDHERRLTLTGNVDVLQNDARMQANKLTLFFRPAVDKENGASPPAGAAPEFGSGDIDRIIAEGDVHYVRPAQKARGDLAIYEAKTDTVTFTGNVVISSDENVIRGEKLVMQVGAGRTTLLPANTPGQRVRGVLHPKQSSAQGAAQPAGNSTGG